MVPLSTCRRKRRKLHQNLLLRQNLHLLYLRRKQPRHHLRHHLRLRRHLRPNRQPRHRHHRLRRAKD